MTDDLKPSKARLVDRLRELLREDHAAAERLARDTAEAANHPEAKPENDKDTRKIELSYLAAGQAARAQELEAAFGRVSALQFRSYTDRDALEVGALVTLDYGDKERRVLLCPAGGGLKLSDDHGDVSVITLQSPLGRELLGKRVGDSLELTVEGRLREIEVIGVE
ncbi:MAG TPA: GreA/GreB family elongation factor [Polyangiaceae bacterium]|nr:GreA/GreB family elongation factor [Polyangiaceae bacterium]